MEKVIAYTDGEARGNPGPAGIGVYIQNEQGMLLKEMSDFIGNSTDDFAQYQGVMTALQALEDMYGKKLKEMEFEIRMGSELVKKQLNHECQIKEPGIVPMFIEIHNMRVSSFPNLIITHVSSNKNAEANRLANEAIETKG